MKRNIILVICLAMGLLTISAQGKKPVAKKPTTAAAKKTNTQATIAMVDAGSGVSLEKPLAEGPDTLYFINQVSRSVLAVDKKTGNISQYIPGNREKMITAIGHDGKDLYMMVTNVGLVRYDGNSLATSSLLFPTSDPGKGLIAHQRAFEGIVFSPNKRWLVAYGSGAILFDLENGACKPVREFITRNVMNLFVFDDGSMIVVMSDYIVSIPNTAAATIKTYHETEGGAKIFKFDDDIKASAIKDGYLYAAWKRCITKTPLPCQDISWEQVYQLEDSDNSFCNFAMGPNSIMAECNEYGKYYMEWPSNDFSGTPKVTDHISTPIKDPLTTLPMKIQRNSDRLHFDNEGNIIMYSYKNLDIYNPNGIKGYTNLKNKRTKYNEE
ncbi:MAG: hypothetical protein ACI3X8_03205 [Alloprevotella sp.]